MSSYPSIRRAAPRRPVWLSAFLVTFSMVLLFAIGFGAAMITGEESRPTVVADGESQPIDVFAIPEPCETTLVAPAEVLPRPDAVVVNVYNSTNRVGLASDVARDLGVRGFRISKVENDPLGVSLRGVGEIRFGAKGVENALLLQFHFPEAALVQDDRSGPRIDISLGRGFEEMEDEAVVAASLASPSPSVSGPGCAV